MEEIIPKKTPAPPLVVRILGYGSATALVVVLVLFLIFQIVKAQTASAIEEVQARLQEQKSAEETSLEREVIRIKKKVDTFVKLADARQDTRRVLQFVEAQTHPQVQFAQFNYEAATGILSLTGQTNSFKTLEEQVAIFETNQNVEEFSLATVALGQGGVVTFGVTVKLK